MENAVAGLPAVRRGVRELRETLESRGAVAGGMSLSLVDAAGLRAGGGVAEHVREHLRLLASAERLKRRSAFPSRAVSACALRRQILRARAVASRTPSPPLPHS